MGEASTVVGLRARARLAYTHHLVELVGRLEAAAMRLRRVDPATLAARAEATRRESARASVRLDGSPLADDTAAAVEAGEHPRAAEGDRVEPAGPGEDGRAQPAGTGEGWARALRLEGLPTQDVAAIEHAGALAALEAEERLAARLFADPRGVLVEAHRLLTTGLVDPERAGDLRRTEQAVHDGAQGQLLYPLPDPEQVPALLEDLCGWLGRDSATVPSPVVAGLVHEALLEWQPFEAAGGRLARVAARLVLRARGLDPSGVLPLDRRASADAAAYHREVAATRRRRGDVVPWLEWWLEGVVDTATSLAEELDHGGAGPAGAASSSAGAPDAAAARAAATRVAARGAGGLTLTEYAAEAGCDREAARAALRAAEGAGLVRSLPGTRRLRFVPAGDAPEASAAEGSAAEGSDERPRPAGRG